MTESDATAEPAGPGLTALADTYQIVGELRGRSECTYLARIRETGESVMATIVRDGANNEISHFASDTNVLQTLDHPNLLRVIDGRWIGTAAFAVVGPRPRGMSLQQMLSAGEKFANPRIATLLQEVNDVLQWARSHGIVHRGVSLETTYIEPGTGRVQLSLQLTPMAVTGVASSRDDAKTIGQLTWLLLRGGEVAGTDGDHEQTLAELRPDLAARVVNGVETMRAPADDAEPQPVETFLSVIATADVLKEAEDELARLQAEFAEMQRAHAEKWEQELAACQRRAEEMEQRLTDERDEFNRTVAAERAALASDQAQLETERSQLEYERAEAAAAPEQPELNVGHRPATPIRDAIDSVRPILQRKKKVGDNGLGRLRLAGIGLCVAALLAAALIVHFARRPKPVPAAVRLGGRTVVPTMPSTDSGRIPRRGFLTQSAGGNLAPSLLGSPLATQPSFVNSADSVPTPIFADSTSTVRVQRDTTVVRRRPRVVVPAPIDSADTARSLAPPTIRLPDTLLRRDSVVRRDTGSFRDSLRLRDSVGLRDSLRLRDSTRRRDSTVRRDTIRPRVDTLP